MPVSEVALIEPGQGPNQVLHENGQRRIVVQANVAGRSIGDVVGEIRQQVTGQVELLFDASILLSCIVRSLYHRQV